MDRDPKKTRVDKVAKQVCKLPTRDQLPEEALFSIRALIISGVDLPSSDSSLLVSVCIGSTCVSTKKVRGQRGYAVPHFPAQCNGDASYRSTPLGQVSHTKGIAHYRQMITADVRLPTDPKQMPDTFLYLSKGPASKDRCVQFNTRVQCAP